MPIRFLTGEALASLSAGLTCRLAVRAGGSHPAVCILCCGAKTAGDFPGPVSAAGRSATSSRAEGGGGRLAGRLWWLSVEIQDLTVGPSSGRQLEWGKSGSYRRLRLEEPRAHADELTVAGLAFHDAVSTGRLRLPGFTRNCQSWLRRDGRPIPGDSPLALHGGGHDARPGGPAPCDSEPTPTPASSRTGPGTGWLALGRGAPAPGDPADHDHGHAGGIGAVPGTGTAGAAGDGRAARRRRVLVLWPRWRHEVRRIRRSRTWRRGGWRRDRHPAHADLRRPAPPRPRRVPGRGGHHGGPHGWVRHAGGASSRAWLEDSAGREVFVPASLDWRPRYLKDRVSRPHTGEHTAKLLDELVEEMRCCPVS